MLFMPDIQSFNMQQIPVLSTSLFTSNLEMSGNEKAVARPGLDYFSQKAYRAIPVRAIMPDRRGEVIRAW